MTDELVRKIQQVLDKRFTNEKQVVYLLVELRKLMDRDGYRNPVLRTFCNWVVHTSLELRAEGSELILSEFDQLMQDVFDRKRTTRPCNHMSLTEFRVSLIKCFDRFGLATTLAKDRHQWKKFSALYCAIVSECPIVYKASRRPLKYVKQVELTRVSRSPIMKEWPLINWRITLKDGEEMNWGFHMP